MPHLWTQDSNTKPKSSADQSCSIQPEGQFKSREHRPLGQPIGTRISTSPANRRPRSRPLPVPFSLQPDGELVRGQENLPKLLFAPWALKGTRSCPAQHGYWVLSDLTGQAVNQRARCVIKYMYTNPLYQTIPECIVTSSVKKWSKSLPRSIADLIRADPQWRVVFVGIFDSSVAFPCTQPAERFKTTFDLSGHFQETMETFHTAH